MTRMLTRRALALLPALGLAATLAACSNDVLEVSNPGSVRDEDLNDPAVAPQMVNTVISEFQSAFDKLIFAGAILSDEAVNGHNYEQWREFDLRIVDETNSVLDDEVYNPIQWARATGDNFTERLQTVLGERAASDLGVARAHAYAGYASIYLGEFFCEAPMDDRSPAIPSDSIQRRAITHFEKTIQVATAAKSQPGVKAAAVDTLINLAHVGAARAALNRGDEALAIQHASAVPAGFEFWANFSDNKEYQENELYYATNGSNRTLGVDPSFRGLNDPRVRHTATRASSHDPNAIVFSPYLAPAHSGYSATAPVTTQLFDRNTDVRLASGLEAQYIVAEAQGLTDANLAFVNARRAVGGQAALPATTTAAEYMAALRDQRRRDFFLDGHRLGDLRRYLELYQVDQFPTGQHPVAQWGNYDVATCYVPHLSERIGNPQY